MKKAQATKTVKMLPIAEINGVVTHTHIDADAGVSTAIVRYLVKKATGREIEVFFADRPWSLDELMKQGYVSLDFGWQGLSNEDKENPLAELYVVDHHKLDQDYSTTKMVAQALGLLDENLINDLIELVDMHDTAGTRFLSSELMALGNIPPRILHLAVVTETLTICAIPTISRRRHNDRQILRRFYNLVTDMIDYAVRFKTELPAEWNKKGRKKPVWIGNHQAEMAIIESTMPDVGSYTRSEAAGYCAVTVSKNSDTGHVLIQANQGCRPIVDLVEVGKIIQVLEMRKRGINTEYKLSELGMEGMLDICPYWWIAVNQRTGVAWIVANGSPKHPYVEPTALSLDEVAKAVVLGLANDVFPECCPSTHCLGRKDCGFYCYGLSRCHDIQTKTE